MNEVNFPKKRSCGIGALIGILTAFSLLSTIYAVLSVIIGIQEKNNGSPIVYGDSPLWFLFWFTLLVIIVWRGRPRLIEWVFPFTIILGFLFINSVATGWHPDTAGQSELAAFSLIMFETCFCIWGVTVLLGIVRWVLISLGIESPSISKD